LIPDREKTGIVANFIEKKIGFLSEKDLF